ncbi:hypothetical protein GPALN_006579 [Globodera pallida]|nr:hypothetical protein GPALN_006579 [Globodera pallida]
MAASGAECGCSKSKSKDVAVEEHEPTGGSQNAQRQEGAQKNSQTESKTENAATSLSANTTTNPAQSAKTVAEKNQFYLTLEYKAHVWQNKK